MRFKADKSSSGEESPVNTLRLGLNRSYYTFAFIFLRKIVLCSKFPRTKFIDYKCLDVRT